MSNAAASMTASFPKRLLALGMLLTILDSTVLAAAGRPLSRRSANVSPADGQSSTSSQESRNPPPSPSDLLISAVDENNTPVPSAQVTLTEAGSKAAFKGETDYAGRFKFINLPPGPYTLQAQKEGFYAVRLGNLRVGQTERVEITLNHEQEYVEVVNVQSAPPGIDPAKTSSSQNLNEHEILYLPYPSPRDIRYALPLLPGVLQSATGQIHLNGSATRQIVDQLDGFNITDPIDGQFNLRMSVDAIRSVELQGSRSSAAFGKGSGGLLNLTTSMGDDHFRVTGTDFLPSLESQKGIHFKNYTPRVTFSGPLRKGKAWFLEALEGEYSLNLLSDLPNGANQSPVFRASNLSKAQINLSQSNILSVGLLMNDFRALHAGLSPFNPLQATVNLGQWAYLLTMKDQLRLDNGVLLEMGLGISQFHNDERPLGTVPFVIRPEGNSGNFFETAHGRAGRLQGIANVIVPPVHWRGRHEFQVGMDLDRITDHQSFQRTSLTIYRENGTRDREITFAGNPSFEKDNFETSAYSQDRWSVSDRLLLESGIRLDRDEILRRVLVSPRLASTYLLTPQGDTKLTMGIGLYYDATILNLITRALEGQRFDFVYDSTGQTLARPPFETLFHVDPRNLRGQRFLNWSVAVEHKFPASVYGGLEFLEKRGRHGWAFINNSSGQNPGGLFELESVRQDHYDAAQVSVRRRFKGDHIFFASYTHSVASSNAVIDFSLNNAIFSPQAGGRLPWDSPNRLLSWGILPLIRRFDVAYSLDWRDGYAFGVVNQNQQLVGSPSSHRFPAYFSLNLFLERRIHLLGFQWALRAGFDDITDRPNPSAVSNNIDSSSFLTYGGLQSRAFTGRIRLLGRK